MTNTNHVFGLWDELEKGYLATGLSPLGFQRCRNMRGPIKKNKKPQKNPTRQNPKTTKQKSNCHLPIHVDLNQTCNSEVDVTN